MRLIAIFSSEEKDEERNERYEARTLFDAEKERFVLTRLELIRVKTSKHVDYEALQ